MENSATNSGNTTIIQQEDIDKLKTDTRNLVDEHSTMIHNGISNLEVETKNLQVDICNLAKNVPRLPDDDKQDELKSSFTSNINKEDIDEETACRLRGDAIGHTLYSATFVTKTLLKFKDMDWNEDFEDNLCFLWDMTVEKDVCDYLLKLSYPSLVANSVLNANDYHNRFVEIVVGILGNIVCSDRDKSHVEIMNLDDVNIVLSLLGHDDPLILIQVVRFLQGLVYLKYEEFRFVKEEFLEKIVFILGNSMNRDLLELTLDFVSKLTLDQNIKADLVKGDLLHSSIVAYQTLKKQDDYSYDNRQGKAIGMHLLQIITNYCLYIDSAAEIGNRRIFNEIIVYKDTIFKIINATMNYYTNEESLSPIPDEIDFYFDTLNIILKTIGVDCLKDLLLNLMKILRHCILNEYDYKFLIITFTYLLSETREKDLDDILSGFEHLPLCINVLKDNITNLQSDCKEIANTLRTINQVSNSKN